MLRGNAGEVTGVAWCSTDPTQIVTCHDNATVSVWTLDRSRDVASEDVVSFDECMLTRLCSLLSELVHSSAELPAKSHAWISSYSFLVYTGMHALSRSIGCRVSTLIWEPWTGVVTKQSHAEKAGQLCVFTFASCDTRLAVQA